MKNIATALVKAQKAFAPALKNAINPHFKSKYVDLASCVNAVIDALNDNGIFLFQTTTEHTNGILCETSFLHESGERLDCGKLFFPAPKNDPQGFMSCLTYIRRASLMSATGQAPEDDDGNIASRPATGMSDNEINRHLQDIEKAKDQSELLKAYTKAYKSAQVLSDTKSITMIVKAKNAAKTKFTELVNESA